MKKTLSITLALIMLLTSVFMSFSAYADAKAPSEQTLNTKISTSLDKLVKNSDANAGGKYSYDVSDSASLWFLVSSGKDMSAYKADFVAKVKANLNKNGGKLISTVVVGYDEYWTPIKETKETAYYYASTILVLDSFGYDVTNFNGVNLVKAMKAVNINDETDGPNTFGTILTAAEKFNLGESYINAALDRVMTYYTKGEGVFWSSFNCDNDASLIVTLAPYKNSYKEVISDLLALIETYKVEGGYFSTAEWGDTSANADSTGIVLAAYSVLGDKDKALEVYNYLLGFEVKDGGFDYQSNASFNSLATKDAVTGLLAYRDNIIAVKATPSVTPEAKIKASTLKVSLSTTVYTYNGEAKNPKVTVTDKKGNKVSSKYYTVTKAKGRKNVGKFTYTIKFKDKYTGTVKKSFTIKPAKTKIKSLTKGNKAFTVKWTKKTKQVDGYQLCYSTSSKFASKYTVTKTVKSNKTTSKTVKKLKGSKKYYVRIRTYKTVDGKKYYSNWSKVMTVKTKK